MQPGVTPATTWTTVGMAVATLIAIVLKHAAGVDLGADGMGAVSTLMAFILPYFAPDARRGHSPLTDDQRKKVQEYVQSLIKEEK